MLKPNQISSPSPLIWGAACFIICEISLFVTAANWETILLLKLTRIWHCSLGGTGGESVNSTGLSS